MSSPGASTLPLQRRITELTAQTCGAASVVTTETYWSEGTALKPVSTLDCLQENCSLPTVRIRESIHIADLHGQSADQHLRALSSIARKILAAPAVWLGALISLAERRHLSIVQTMCP